MIRTTLVTAVFLAAGSLAQSPAPAPAPAGKPAAAKTEETPVYDEKADAKADITAALARAKHDNKRVLLQWGANWCGWCKLLHGLMKSDATIAKAVLYEYEVVRIDVGRFNKNIELADGYQANLKASGIPYLTVLDADGKVLVNQVSDSLELPDKSKPGHDPKAVLGFLTKYQAPALDANAVWTAALERAKSEQKRVFMHFGAPWCGWCHQLENWMAQKDVSALLATDYVDLKIDVDRMQNAAAIQARFPSSKNAGIPWFAIVDASGEVLANSDGVKGNIGFPSADDEIAHFIGMLDKSRSRLKPEDLATLKASLEVWRDKLKH